MISRRSNRIPVISQPTDKKRIDEQRQRIRRQSLDGDGTWRLSTGERRVAERRGAANNDSHLLDIPFFDDEEPDEDNSGENPHSVYNPAANLTAGDTADSSTSAAPGDAETADDSASANAPVPTADALTAATTAKKNDDVVAKKLAESTTTDTDEKLRQARLQQLKGTLQKSDARQQRLNSRRQPLFSVGLQVRVLRGNFADQEGVILDADYIESRALVSLPDQPEPQWLPFTQLGAAAQKT